MSTKKTSDNQDLLDAAPAPLGELLFEYDVPADMQEPMRLPNGSALLIKSVLVKRLRASDEVLAARRVGRDAARMVFELCQIAFAGVNGKRFDDSASEGDAVWAVLDPRLRSLLMAAYQELNAAKETQQTAFLKSCRVKTG
jgi:hypothetical protein